MLNSACPSTRLLPPAINHVLLLASGACNTSFLDESRYLQPKLHKLDIKSQTTSRQILTPQSPSTLFLEISNIKLESQQRKPHPIPKPPKPLKFPGDPRPKTYQTLRTLNATVLR